MPKTGPFDLTSQRLAALPVVEHCLDRAGLPALLERYLPPPTPGCGWRQRSRCGWW